MSLQRDLIKVDAEIDKIRFDPAFLQLKNKKRSDFDTKRYTKYTRQLERLKIRRKAIVKKMEESGMKPENNAPVGKYMETKPAWRNQANKIAHRNQNDGKVAQNWVKDRKAQKKVAVDFPAKRNALKPKKPAPAPEPPKISTRVSARRAQYRKPVVRNASEIAKLKVKEKARLSEKLRPVNNVLRTNSRRQETVQPLPERTVEESSDSSEENIPESYSDVESEEVSN